LGRECAKFILSVKAGGLEKRVERASSQRRFAVADVLQKFWQNDQGQDVAEYAVMLAVILVIVVGTVRLIGSNANTVFSQVGSQIQ
jgi:pilus assembly protein Flp/PilA